jgi:hypothetical protein
MIKVKLCSTRNGQRDPKNKLQGNQKKLMNFFFILSTS